MNRWRTVVLPDFLTFKRFVYYGFPIYLLCAEYVIKSLLGAGAEALGSASIASSLSVAGLSLVAPVLIPKPVALTEGTQQGLAQQGVTLIGQSDLRLIYAAFVALLALPFAWGKAILLAEATPRGHFLQVPYSLAAALLVYLVGIVLTEIKEIV